ncbi:MAG: GAF domain-containing protein [Gordonia amarae]
MATNHEVRISGRPEPAEHRWADALDALTKHGGDDPRLLRDLLDAVLVVGQGLELDEALQRIVEVAVGVVDAQYGALGVRGGDGGLSEFVHIGITPDQRAIMGHLPVGRGVLGLLIKEPQVLRIPHLSAHPSSVGFPPHHPPMETFLGAPITVRGSNFGSIYLTEKRNAEEFTKVDETLIAMLAVAAGIAVDNARLFEGARTRHRWMQAVARRGSEPLAGIALSDTMSRLCDDVAALTEALDVVILTSSEDKMVVQGRSQQIAGADQSGDVSPVSATQMPIGSSMVVLAAELIPDGVVAGDPDWVTVQPLQRAAGAFGWIVVAHRRRPWWEPEEIAGLAGVAEVASLAVVYAEQQQIARDLEVLEDRHRIARDLHDHVIQRLFAVGMSMQTMLATPHDDEGTIATPVSRLEQVVVDLDRTIAQIRTSIFDLQSIPGHHDATTLRRRVLDIVSELAVHAPISPSVTFDGPVDTVVPEALGPHIDAVLREGLSNALRHADADRISVLVSADEDVLKVEITDDGKGIDTNVTYRGLENLTTRADECDGTFTIDTTPQRPGRAGGTTLTWTVPLVH